MVLRWKYIPATDACAALSVAGDYVISHRVDRFTVSYRPPGKHIHVGTFTTLEAAEIAAQKHAETF